MLPLHHGWTKERASHHRRFCQKPPICPSDFEQEYCLYLVKRTEVILLSWMKADTESNSTRIMNVGPTWPNGKTLYRTKPVFHHDSYLAIVVDQYDILCHCFVSDLLPKPSLGDVNGRCMLSEPIRLRDMSRSERMDGILLAVRRTNAGL